jgi:hypothetical protein
MSEHVSHSGKHEAHSDKHEAHKRLVQRLRQHSADVQRITAGLVEETMAAHTVPGKWSLKEFVCHLLRAQNVFETRVEAVLSQENPSIASYSPDGDGEFEQMVARPVSDSLADFFESRERFLQRLDQLSPAEWHRKGQHPEYPHYDVHFQVEYMVHHEAHHIYQMFQRRVPLGRMPH